MTFPGVKSLVIFVKPFLTASKTLRKIFLTSSMLKTEAYKALSFEYLSAPCI